MLIIRNLYNFKFNNFRRFGVESLPTRKQEKKRKHHIPNIMLNIIITQIFHKEP